jgi:hypothetical protein
MDPLGFEPRAFRMQSERDTTTPRAPFLLRAANLQGGSVSASVFSS